MKKIIRLTEQDLHRIVRESVNRVINETENYQDELIRQQYKVWKTAKQLLSQKGFEQWDDKNDNPFILRVKINNYKDVELIDSILRSYFGITSEYDCSVKRESNMFGSDERALIHLPAANKVKNA